MAVGPVGWKVKPLEDLQLWLGLLIPCGSGQSAFDIIFNWSHACCSWKKQVLQFGWCGSIWILRSCFWSLHDKTLSAIACTSSSCNPLPQNWEFFDLSSPQSSPVEKCNSLAFSRWLKKVLQTLSASNPWLEILLTQSFTLDSNIF